MRVSLLLIFFFNSAFTANILGVFENPTTGHLYYQSRLMEALARRGHTLTIFTGQRLNIDTNGTSVVQHIFENSFSIHTNLTSPIKRKQQNLSWFRLAFEEDSRVAYETSRSDLANSELQRLLKEGKRGDFDLVIIECYFCHLTVLADIFDCPVVVSVASEANFMLHALMGNEFSPALYPEVYALPFLHRHLTLGERIESLAYSLVFLTIHGLIRSEPRQLEKEFFAHVSTNGVLAMQRRTALLLTNTNVAFGHARPLMPNTAQVGFMHIEPPKDIKDEELKNFLNAASEGVIVMSFGTISDTSHLDPVVVETFLNAFNQTTMKVLWKVKTIDQKVPENVFLYEWLPLADVLAHPNVKMIITQGGILTAYEAIDREVPMIVFPLAYDQGANAKMLVSNGVAVELDLNTFSERDLLTAIEEVTKDEYKEKIKRLRKRVYDQPIHPRDLAIWHIESVLRHGNDLKVPTSGYAEHLQRYYLDLIALVISTFVTLWCFCKILRKIMQKGTNQKLKCD